MKRWTIIALVIFIAATVCVLMMSPRTVQKMQGGFLGVLTPFLKSGSDLDKKIKAIGEGLKSLEELEKENDQLTVENKRLRAENQLLADVQKENEGLRKALEYRERSVFKLVSARVIGRDASSWWNTVIIDRGLKDGIEAEMPVVTDKGLVGKTTIVDDHMARVILVLDEACKVAVSVDGSQERGILWAISGVRAQQPNAPELAIRFLPKTADLKPGQKVRSSGMGGVFPSGLLIGEVTEFAVRELDAQAKVKPEVDLVNVEDVFVIVGRKEKEK